MAKIAPLHYPLLPPLQRTFCEGIPAVSAHRVLCVVFEGVADSWEDAPLLLMRKHRQHRMALRTRCVAVRCWDWLHVWSAGCLLTSLLHAVPWTNPLPTHMRVALLPLPP